MCLIVFAWRPGHALPLLVAAILWGKGTLVARHFIESHRAHPFIAWLLRAFILLTPLLLLLTAFFGRPVARSTAVRASVVTGRPSGSRVTTEGTSSAR